MKPRPKNTYGSYQSSLMDQSALDTSNAALQSIYIKHFPAVKQYILKNSGDENDAKDIYQEAFVVFWRNLNLGKFEATHEGATGAYLLKIAKFKWIDLLRKNKNNALYLDDNVDILQEEAFIDEQADEYLNQVVTKFRKMEEPCKELLHRFYYLKENLKTIAKRFSWTEATAKNNKYRCLQKLRKSITISEKDNK